MPLRAALISPRTRRAFREALVGAYLRHIDELFTDEGFKLGEEPDDDVPGEGRRKIEQYFNAIDWSSEQDEARVLRVFEGILRREETSHENHERAVELLEQDGYEVRDGGFIRRASLATLSEGALANLDEPTVIRRHLRRIEEAIEEDPELALGAAKELIESTANTLIRRSGRTLEIWNMPTLLKEAQGVLFDRTDVLPEEKQASGRHGNSSSTFESWRCASAASETSTGRDTDGSGSWSWTLA